MNRPGTDAPAVVGEGVFLAEPPVLWGTELSWVLSVAEGDLEALGRRWGGAASRGEGSRELLSSSQDCWVAAVWDQAVEPGGASHGLEHLPWRPPDLANHEFRPRFSASRVSS